MSGRPTTLVWHRRGGLWVTAVGRPPPRPTRASAASSACACDATCSPRLSWHAVMAVVLAAAPVVFLRRRQQRCRVAGDRRGEPRQGPRRFSTIVKRRSPGGFIAVLPSPCQAPFPVPGPAAPGVAPGHEDRLHRHGRLLPGGVRTWLPGAAHVVDRFRAQRAAPARRLAPGPPSAPVSATRPRCSATATRCSPALTGSTPRRWPSWAPLRVRPLGRHLGDHPALPPHLPGRRYEAPLQAINEFVDAWIRTEADLGAGVKTLLRWSDEWLPTTPAAGHRASPKASTARSRCSNARPTVPPQDQLSGPHPPGVRRAPPSQPGDHGSMGLPAQQP